jgi:hypothetical protein
MKTLKIMTPALAACLLAGAAAAATQYVYPTGGQDRAQQARDEAACSTWATQQTGYDPAKKTKAQTGASVDTVTKALGSPEGAAAISALAGKNAGTVNSITGALSGAGGSTTSGSATTNLLSQAVAQQHPQTTQPSGEHDFYRARAACLSGKGYSVQ